MLLQSLLLLGALSSGPFCLAQDASPTVAGTVPDGAGVLAANPTASGQLDMAPNDIPEEDELAAPVGVDTDFLEEVVTGDSTSTKWIGTTTDFGTATITTTQGGQTGETTIPQGLRLVLNDEGEIEITISQLVQDELNRIEDEIKVPRCESLLRRNLDKRDDLECSGRRIVPIIGGVIGSDLMMKQVNYAEERTLEYMGLSKGYLDEKAMMISYFDAELTHDALNATKMGNPDLFGTMPERFGGTVASFGLFTGMHDDADTLHKVKAKVRVIPKYPLPTPSEECEKGLACVGERCKGVLGVCTNEWEGCPCQRPAKSIADPFLWGTAWEWFIQTLSRFEDVGDVPAASCSANDGAGNNNVANVEAKTWKQLVDNFCKTKPNLNGSFSENWKPADLDVSESSDWTFDFSVEASEDGACAAYSCDEVFGKFRSCTYDSHSSFRSGEVKLSCGTARYKMNDPQGSPKTKLVKQNEYCYDKDQFGKHTDVQRSTLRWQATFLCTQGISKPRIKAGDSSTNQDWYQVKPYQFNAYWRNGCELETGETEMGILDPLATGTASVDTSSTFFMIIGIVVPKLTMADRERMHELIRDSPPWYKVPSLIKFYLLLIAPLMTSAAVLGFFGASVSVGGTIGCLICGPLVEYFGRRPLCSAGAVLVVGIAIMQTWATNFEMIVSGKILIGLGVVLQQAAAPVLVSELAHPKQRVSITSFYNTNIFIGLIIGGWATIKDRTVALENVDSFILDVSAGETRTAIPFTKYELNKNGDGASMASKVTFETRETAKGLTLVIQYTTSCEQEQSLVVAVDGLTGNSDW
ncbi:hypothetical protein CEP54_012191 [Fusarium duplospermum]|uniref:Major facilitator superfamily (MFS) profile domain-containing protein n=1 Tax=Fusarium duplospermum TaxID=1325734 RepID=A0A428PA64_9HYPO|nr:hypothetical protein CEP54_012191 [Fusarium duplospermum]